MFLFIVGVWLWHVLFIVIFRYFTILLLKLLQRESYRRYVNGAAIVYIVLIVLELVYFIYVATIGSSANMWSGLGITVLQGIQFLFILFLAITSKAFERSIVNAPQFNIIDEKKHKMYLIITFFLIQSWILLIIDVVNTSLGYDA